MATSRSDWFRKLAYQQVRITSRVLMSFWLGLVSLSNTSCEAKKDVSTLPSYRAVRRTPQQTPPSPQTFPSRSSQHPVQRTGQEFAYAVSVGDGDTLLQFQITRSGQLSPLSPAVVTAGQTVNSLTADPQGRCVYAASAKENTVVEFRIKPDGTLEVPAAFSIPASGLVTEIITTPDGHTLYAATTSGNIDQIDVQPDGSLRFHSQASLVTPNSYMSLATDLSGRFFYFGYNGALKQMRIGQSGALKPLSPFAADSGTFYHIAISADGRFVYGATYTEDMGSIRQYRVNANGTLHLLTHDHVLFNAHSLVSHPRKPYLYACGFFGKEAVWKFDILPNGRLKRLWPVNVSNPVSASAHATFSFSIDPTGRFAYAALNDFTQYPPPATQLIQYQTRADGRLRRILPSPYSYKQVFGAPTIVRR